jgi:hypothetical protein
MPVIRVHGVSVRARWARGARFEQSALVQRSAVSDRSRPDGRHVIGDHLRRRDGQRPCSTLRGDPGGEARRGTPPGVWTTTHLRRRIGLNIVAAQICRYAGDP